MQTAASGHAEDGDAASRTGEVVVVGASAGGVEALQRMLGSIPPDLGASVLVVLHMPPTGGEALAAILDRAGPLPAAIAIDREPLAPGRVYVAAGGRHLLVEGTRLRAVRGPRENGHRPAVDPLFRSTARHWGKRAVGVVLSGTLSDGTAGLASIRRSGGIAVVQEPGDALYDGMPRHAIEQAGADHVVPAGKIGSLLGELCVQSTDLTPGRFPLSFDGEEPVMQQPVRHRPSEWACPDCGGVLWEASEDDEMLWFKCRVGHAWSPVDLLANQSSQVETALWVALRSLEDRVALSCRLAARAEETGRSVMAARHRDDVEELEQSAQLLRSLLAGTPGDAGVKQQDE
jgi:two-component system chemotaxis response regulator CheB